MASLKLCALLLVCIIFVLVSDSECRRRNRHRQRGSTGVTGGQESTSNGHTPVGRRRPNAGGRQNPGPGGRRPWRRNNGRGRGIGPNRRRGGRPGCRGRRCGERPEFDFGPLARSMNTFSIKSFRQVANISQSNFVFSPVSLSSAMSMVLLGAAGGTEREIISALNIGLRHHFGLGRYMASLNITSQENATLSLANAIFIKPDFEVVPRFSRLLRRLYSTDVQRFAGVAPHTSVNNWVQEKTGGEITDFLAEGAITPDSKVMLINAMYFKGLWQNKFNTEYTTMETFQVSDTERAEVEMMSVEAKFKSSYSDILRAQVLELPYKGGRFALFIILPVEDSLNVVASRMTSSNLDDFLNIDTPERKLTVKLPKFGLNTKRSMKQILQNLGVNAAFNASLARFTKMSQIRGLYINEVHHQAIFKVDEEGTVAASASGVDIVLMSTPDQFIANKPFIFVLRDKTYGINLFMGQYTDPAGSNLM